MKFYTLARLYLAMALSIVAATSHAQMSAANQAGLNSAMMKLFGATTAFSSRADVRMVDQAGKETMSMSMNFALLDGKVRLEVDMTQIKSQELTPAMIGPLKQMGMDKMVSIVRPDKKVTLVIYPALKAYAEVPMSSEEAADFQKEYKLEKTSLGKETLDGHPCGKNRVVVSDAKTRQEAVVWNAADLKDFPIQMQMNQPEANVILHYKEIQLAKPEARQFEAPAGFTKHDSMDKLVQGAMMRSPGGK